MNDADNINANANDSGVDFYFQSNERVAILRLMVNNKDFSGKLGKDYSIEDLLNHALMNTYSTGLDVMHYKTIDHDNKDKADGAPKYIHINKMFNHGSNAVVDFIKAVCIMQKAVKQVKEQNKESAVNSLDQLSKANYHYLLNIVVLKDLGKSLAKDIAQPFFKDCTPWGKIAYGNKALRTDLLIMADKACEYSNNDNILYIKDIKGSYAKAFDNELNRISGSTTAEKLEKLEKFFAKDLKANLLRLKLSLNNAYTRELGYISEKVMEAQLDAKKAKQESHESAAELKKKLSNDDLNHYIDMVKN